MVVQRTILTQERFAELFSLNARPAERYKHGAVVRRFDNWMRIADYIFDEETIHAQTQVFQGGDAVSSTESGELACTSQRLLYANGKELVDISLPAIDAMGYSAKRYPSTWAVVGSLFGIISVVTFLISLSADIPSAIPMAFGVLSIVVIAIGWMLRRSSLEIHTPSKSFTFTSKDDLATMAQMIRGLEDRR